MEADEEALINRTLVVVGAVVTLLGCVFALQGFGVLKGSTMSNTTTWSVAGPIIAIAGLVIGWRGARNGRS